MAITREAEGISLFRRDRPGGPIAHTHIPTNPVAVFDVTGAGDAVVSTIAIALACRIEMTDACALANLAGRAVVRQFGVGTISPGHLLAEAGAGSADRMIKVADLASSTPARAKSSRLVARSFSPTVVSTSSTLAMPICCNTPVARATSSF